MPKNILIITSTIVAVIIFGATAAYITLRQGGGEVRQEQPVVTLPEAPEEPIVQPEEPTTTEPIDTSDWKTYQSSTMGFSVKYPPDWEVISEHAYLGGQRVAFKFANAEFAVIQGATIYSEEKGRNLTFEEIVDAERRLAQNHIDPAEEQIFLDDRPAIAISYTQYWARAEQYIRLTHVYEESENFWMYLTIYEYSEIQENQYSPIFDTMLLSFRFLK